MIGPHNQPRIPADRKWHNVGVTHDGMVVQRFGGDHDDEEAPLRVYSRPHDAVIWQGDMRACRELIAALNTAYETKVNTPCL